ncbi:cobalamin-independent methionine synthase [Atractiella rhizophila]|nr:cobalamin-independent methionine synthase [Atractiella rhizophila]
MPSSHVKSAVLGFPRIGPKREIKKAIEAYWGDKLSVEELLKVAKEQRLLKYKIIKDAGVDYIPSGDFTLYDHILDTSITFNAIPHKYAAAQLSQLDTEFAMGRGRQRDGVDLEACEMKKWFDSNYHYIVPEFSSSTSFKLNNTKPVDEFLEAKQGGYVTRPVLVGPLTYLLLGKSTDSSTSFKPISLLSSLLPIYKDLLSKLKEAGASDVQIDEPILVMDLASDYEKEFKEAYDALGSVGVDITLATYYGRLESNLDFVKTLKIKTLHVDLDRSPEQLNRVLEGLKGTNIGISLGVISGRNIWKGDFAKSIGLGKKALEAYGGDVDKVVIATSSSLLHTPVSLDQEKKLKPEVKDWFSFATEKAKEVAVIARALTDEKAVEKELGENQKSIQARRDFEKNSDSAVRERVAKVTEADYRRASPFLARVEAQKKVHQLPKFPTTTIGSFPQTKEIRTARAKLGKKEITEAEYEEFIKKEIQHVVEFQEKIDLDILVHGEPERNDMVQYFGEQLKGFVFTENAWVQSYGSRYVRPPIIVSDVSRPGPMTVKWSSYAQSLSKKPVKGMLTGPVTILNWSFPRVDVSREIQSRQLALALRDEVLDLEAAGIFAIQVDEPAIREGLPLRKSDWNNYLTWAVDSFRLSTAGVKDSTQTHSHFCYSDFNDIFDHIIRLDADVISIEASKSALKLLNAFTEHKYTNDIGPGVYDIHSPRVPGLEELKDRITAMLKHLPAERLFINPDCGLKTRGWKETEESLKNLTDAAKWARTVY